MALQSAVAMRIRGNPETINLRNKNGLTLR